jgi:co-chaperonin GroES (HSP10)
MSKVNVTKTYLEKLHPPKDTIIVCDMEFTERKTSSGIILIDDDMKSSGIRPRWAKVYAIGREVKDIQVGQYIYVSHGRWSRGVTIETPEGEKIIRKVDPNDILLVSDEYISDYNIGIEN